MKVNIFEPYAYHEKDMDMKELVSFKREVAKDIMSWFKWKDYEKEWNHMVYYVELNGIAYVYPSGYLMQEDEFNDLIADREGIGLVGAYHRK